MTSLALSFYITVSCWLSVCVGQEREGMWEKGGGGISEGSSDGKGCWRAKVC